MNDRERRVRDEAYKIWEEKGRPDGDDHSHWHEAESRVSASERPVKRAANDAPKRKAPLKGAAVDIVASKPKQTPPAKKPVVKGAANAGVKTPLKLVEPKTAKAAKPAEKSAAKAALKGAAKPARTPKG